MPVAPGTSFFQVVTASARSRVYGLAVPAVQSDPRERDDIPVSTPRPDTQPADVDCSEFSTQRSAQAFHDRYFDLFGDFARLDGSDDDGRACEALP